MVGRSIVGAASISLLALAAFAACGDDVSAGTNNNAPDASTRPPGPCALSPSPTPICAFGVDSVPDSGVGDAAADAGGGLVVAPESENRCLVTYDRTLDCPSLVAPVTTGLGTSGGTELIVGQRGVSGGDYQAYSERIAIDPGGNGTVISGVVPPYKISGFAPASQVGIGGGTDAPSVVVLTSNDTKSSTLSFGALGAGMPTLTTSISAPIVPSLFDPHIVTSPAGETFIADRGALLRGIPAAPRVVANSINTYDFGIALDTRGEPAAIVSDGTNLRILEGEGFTEERWSVATRSGINQPIMQLAYAMQGGASSPVFVTRPGDGEEARVYWLHDGEKGPNTPFATLGQSYSTCPRANYLGVTCDACPVGQQCVAGADEFVVTRIFVRRDPSRAGNDRVFVAYTAHDFRRTLTYAKHTTPIINVACSCVLEEVSRQQAPDALIVVELVDGGAGAKPGIIERMRLPLGGVPTGLIHIGPRSDGEVDVVLGPEPVMFSQEGPSSASKLRVLHVSTASIP